MVVKSIATPRVTYGGWFPRTTIHLREVYQLFFDGTSHLALDRQKLRSLWTALDLKKVTREAGSLEFVEAITNGGLEIRYYEDGLFTITSDSLTLSAAKEVLEQYHERRLAPALGYIFSLGAPTPKALANIKTHHPLVISLHQGHDNIPAPKTLGEHIYEQVSANNLTVYKSRHFFLIIGSKIDEQTLREVVEMQIFFREFKDQLSKYLDIHRTIWEEIEQIKEKQYLRGDEISLVRSRLDAYQKTINLISNRINQMGTYVATRKSIAQSMEIEEALATLFQYKFEVLLNTLAYVTELWEMTENYLSSAIEVIGTAQSQSTNSSIDSLRIITTVGVLSGLLGYLASSELPSVTAVGTQYFVLLLAVTLIINVVLGYLGRRRRYRVSIAENSFQK